MKLWEESDEEVRRISPDKEIAKSIEKMIKVRLKALEVKDKKEFASLVVEDYYEIIKESITALMAVDGYKTLSHEVLVGFLKNFYRQFTEEEIFLIDQLRILRNKIAYKGFFINYDYLKRNEPKIKPIILKLTKTLNEKIK
ncbi:MAG: hypothetical protein COY38_00875 [Candidatus Aenigmarchaeota archaeon CG_4_10_14_0_8_um_filter_37_24]|nr:hypothetical protein [Candidatus Aenigmarchaeota archaeon]OIN86192.1 MAG: hypothetical protein AUJ50_03905 [Candidatus Aenigmarchaeota archaeon CG1_02_38_14]PIV68765.1 MAG: hypothetical protein COS07_03045 [Candidatus Aenigmarchaeota archaeon CG01_land_8_20_14_3_00_37_9]PIX50460.1 MAG: hypothetical protein COZ52_04005 [Candidatus Aenigmarchaeota archaeon CG_4_8_14_3_um_filter_37_24]PIY35095.1 MAG: hypothetical protein COZ04_04590 [Candidatus Aenigmarchaeota archaeon CG_4_10_14_3_um_filter_37